jgi:hypothetical protein
VLATSSTMTFCIVSVKILALDRVRERAASIHQIAGKKRSRKLSRHSGYKLFKLAIQKEQRG